jgi:hypothetical protein
MCFDYQVWTFCDLRTSLDDEERPPGEEFPGEDCTATKKRFTRCPMPQIFQLETKFSCFYCEGWDEKMLDAELGGWDSDVLGGLSEAARARGRLLFWIYENFGYGFRSGRSWFPTSSLDFNLDIE